MLYDEALKLVATLWFDNGHGGNRDFWCGATAMGLKPFLYLIMIVLNLAHGPEESDLRFNQIKDTLTDHFEHMTPGTSPIFKQLQPMLKAEATDMVVEDGQNEDDALWTVIGIR